MLLYKYNSIGMPSFARVHFVRVKIVHIIQNYPEDSFNNSHSIFDVFHCFNFNTSVIVFPLILKHNDVSVLVCHRNKQKFGSEQNRALIVNVKESFECQIEFASIQVRKSVSKVDQVPNTIDSKADKDSKI